MRPRALPLIRGLLRRIETEPLAVVACAVVAGGALWLSSCGSISFNAPWASTPVTTTRPSARPQRSVAAALAEPTLRVRIAHGVESAIVAGPARALVGLAARTTDNELMTPPLSITRSETVWRVQDAEKNMRAFAAIGDAERDAGLLVEGVGPTPLTLDGKPYPGKLTFVPARERASAAPSLPGDAQVAAKPIAGADAAAAQAAAPPSPTSFDVVEHVAIERYLPGVLARELPAGWAPATFRAQAIIARSYALHERDRAQRAGRHFDLESGERDQAYAGVTADPVVESAVRETRGAVLTFQGRTLRAYYSSTCGGRSASARDVWPITAGFEFNTDAPIQEHANEDSCSASPLYRWSVTRTREELTRRIVAFGRDNGLGVRQLKSFAGATASAHNAGGRPTQYKVFDADGTWWPLSAERLRMACNWTGSSGLPAVTRSERVNSGDATFSLDGAKVVIAGRGFGHGVGLCQYGAQGMARQGKGVEEILRFYYPGARIERAY